MLKERWVMLGLVGGMLLFFVGGFLAWIFTAAGAFRATYTRDAASGRVSDVGTLPLAGIGYLLVILGLLVFGYTLFYSLWIQKTGRKRGQVKTDPSAYVVARYALDQGHNMALDFDMADDDTHRFYVKLRLSNFQIVEFECAREIALAATDGIYGEATYRGDWLGGFRPLPRNAPNPTGTPYEHL